MNKTNLVKYLRGQSNDDECSQVELWSEESPENRKVLEQLYYTLFVGDRVATMDAVNTESSLVKLKTIIQKTEEEKVKQKKIFSFKRSYAAIAAAFIAGIIATGGITLALLSNKTIDYSVITAVGQRAQTVLPDGSKVWLNASTEVKYKDTFWSSGRQVYLSGEAYFEVTHDKNAPFVVNSKQIETTVLGTKFNVRAREKEEQVVTTLFEGLVQVDFPEAKGAQLLTPGQTLNINTTTYQAELIEYTQPTDVLLWIDGRLAFKQHSLLEITEIMEKLYDVRFVFEDETLKSEHFTGEFSTDSTPEDILSVLGYTNYVSYKREGQIIYLMKE